MHTAIPHQESMGLDVHDVLFALIRNKWKIVLLSILGIAAGGAYYVNAPQVYQSEAKLLVKYVLDRTAVDTVESQSDTTLRYGDSLMPAEVAILSSWDLAAQVAAAVGPDRLFGDTPGEHTASQAAGVARAGLEVKTAKGSNVISVTFRHSKPDVPRPVLEEFVRHYFDVHMEVHRSIQAFDFVSQQRDLVRARLTDLDAKIKTLKDQAGINSLGDSESLTQGQIALTRQQLQAAEAELAVEKALFEFLTKSKSAETVANDRSKTNADAAASIPPESVQRYQAVIDQLAFCLKNETDLLTRYTEQSVEVKSSRQRVAQLRESRTALEAEYPGLRTVTTMLSEPGKTVDVMAAQSQLVAAQARVAVLGQQLNELKTSADKVNAVWSQLKDLEGQRQVEQKNYVDFQTKLERARIDEALDPSKIPNISVLQKPSPATPVAGKTVAVSGGLAAGGVGLGLATALLLGLVFDRSVKRPRELEALLHTTTLISIPRLAKRSARGLEEGRTGGAALSPHKESKGAAAPWDVGHFIRPFAETIRNRLIMYFEFKKIVHKPKLVGVTSLSKGEGVSTMAGGLAASLSETGDGKVLLVDMNADNPEMRSFLEGHASSSLRDVLRSENEVPSAAENLFLAAGRASDEPSISIAPKRFYELMPVLRASAFDYIIFDLPPLDQSGASLAVSGLMDKIVLMVEAEKSDRHAVKRAYQELIAAQADVATVFNKTDYKMPKWALG